VYRGAGAALCHRANRAVLERLAEIDDKLLEHDDTLRDLYEKILLLLDPPHELPRGRVLGFHKDG
jgi:hypothetical protein